MSTTIASTPPLDLLIATDFSDAAYQAALRAALLCQEGSARQGSLLHIIERSFWRRPTPADGRSAQQQLQELTDRLQARTGLLFPGQIRQGRLRPSLVTESARHDLLLLGARGSHPLQDHLIGATAEQVVHRGTQPLLMVYDSPRKAYQRVLVAIDFSPTAAANLRLARRLAPTAPVHLMHCCQAPFEKKMLSRGLSSEAIGALRNRAHYEAENQMKAFLDSLDPDAPLLDYSIEPEGGIVTNLRRKTREIGADLLVVGHPKPHLAERLLRGSVTVQLLDQAPCDILVCP
jgi:nucleotide-binding universal stress UspA family protein